MTPLLRLGSLAIITGVLAACVGDVPEEDEAEDLGESQAAIGPSVTYPAYIAYAQPVPGINPLYTDVANFIAGHDSGANEAASFPPHVTLTGFFDTSLSTTALIARFHSAVAAVGVPFGHPLITPKNATKASKAAVQCDPGRRLVTLHVRLTSDYRRFRAELSKAIPGVKGHGKATSHITLFQALHPKAISAAAFNSICADARNFFVERIPFYNSSADGYPYWQVTLLRAPAPPTPTHPLLQSNAIAQVRVNP